MTRIVAVVPAFDEEGAIGSVVEEIHAFDPAIDVVVVDDGSTDETAANAARRGRGGRPPPVQPRDRRRGADRLPVRARARLRRRGAARRRRSARPLELPKLLEPLAATRRTWSPARGSATDGSGYRPPLARGLGISWFARLVSLLSGQRVTDTTSGFQALNRRGIALFASDYPSDYPEVEATVLLLKHRLRLVEVPVRMREREHGSSSITFLRSLYYAVKVTLALLVAMGRRYAVPSEGVER